MEVQQEAIRTGWCGAELVADSQVTAATGAFSLKFEFSGSVQCFPSCGSGRSSRSMWGAVTRLLWEKKTKLWDTNLLQKSRIIWPLWSSNSYYKGAVLCWVFVVFLNVISYFPSQIFRLTVTHRIHPHRSSQSDSSLSRLVHYRGWMMTSSVCVCVCVCVCHGWLLLAADSHQDNAACVQLRTNTHTCWSSWVCEDIEQSVLTLKHTLWSNFLNDEINIIKSLGH